MRYVCSKASSSDDADFIVCRGLGDCYLVLVGCVGGCCFNNEANKSFIWHHRPGDALLGMMSHVIKNPKTCWDSCRHLQFAWVFLLKAFKVQSMIGVAKFISELLDVMQGADSDNQSQTSTTISQISDQPGWLELM